MSDCPDTAHLSPDERLRQAAAILASGVLRLRRLSALPPEVVQEKSAELSATGLEVPAQTVLSVHTG